MGAWVHDIDGWRTSVQSPAIVLPPTGALTLTFSYYFEATVDDVKIVRQ